MVLLEPGASIVCGRSCVGDGGTELEMGKLVQAGRCRRIEKSQQSTHREAMRRAKAERAKRGNEKTTREFTTTTILSKHGGLCAHFYWAAWRLSSGGIHVQYIEISVLAGEREARKIKRVQGDVLTKVIRTVRDQGAGGRQHHLKLRRRGMLD
ncbi:hypothetical protein FRC08_012763 [Ceratobasidium sp. 394]|nr:hypothetical protein FRC08_012763 [Ceratobasidium sp. 394]